MFDESYENYIRSILGYPMSTTTSNSMPYSNCDCMTNYRQNMNHRELEDCYPEIYKIIFPMVTKTCDSIQEPITKELVEQLTDNIYFAIEGNDEVNININLTNEVGGNTSTSRENRQTKTEEKQERETRSPRPVNRNLRDLIKILLLRELLNRPGNRPPVRPPRPPFPGGPGRPPFPGGPGPGRPPMRPPMMPRGLEDYNIYEV